MSFIWILMLGNIVFNWQKIYIIYYMGVHHEMKTKWTPNTKYRFYEQHLTYPQHHSHNIQLHGHNFLCYAFVGKNLSHVCNHTHKWYNELFENNICNMNISMLKAFSCAHNLYYQKIPDLFKSYINFIAIHEYLFSRHSK